MTRRYFLRWTVWYQCRTSKPLRAPIISNDPATDLMPAWLLFDGAARARFLDLAADDDADLRRRGRGWALAWAAACAANRTPQNQLGDLGRRVLRRVVDDWRAEV